MSGGGPADGRAADAAPPDRLAARPPVDVAVGVLIERDAPDREGRFLMTSRPAGKIYAGYWEFPGGKLEAGETVEQALVRELHEELGVRVEAGTGAVQPWRVELFDYDHARVRLHFCKVFGWQGAFEMREQQACAWQTLPVTVSPLLPGSLPVLRWLAMERAFEGATHVENRLS